MSNIGSLIAVANSILNRKTSKKKIVTTHLIFAMVGTDDVTK